MTTTKRSLAFFPFALSVSISLLSLSTQVNAAPAPENTLAQILEKSCNDGTCVEGYKVKFKQISFEGSKEQVTVSLTLLPNQGIDYPIIGEQFEAQLVQGTFAGICRVKQIPSIEAIRMEDGITVNPDFKNRLGLCLSALSQRTESALGR
ncbi:MAG: hypothetical protein EOP07_04115 [Proteobacteria bacterium]|nr:MAG: hypothetical protein EOP07_04115 [Pseudomonadota bacterium]